MNLESNLQEIYAAGHSSNGKIIADLSGLRIYSANSGWGLLYSWIFDIAKFLGMGDLKKDCFEKAMAHTHMLFKEHFSKVVGATNAYRSYLNNKFLGQTVDEAEVAKDRKLIA